MKACVASFRLKIKAFVEATESWSTPPTFAHKTESGNEMKNESNWAEDRSGCQAKKWITAFTQGCILPLHSSGPIDIFNPTDIREI